MALIIVKGLNGPSSAESLNDMAQPILERLNTLLPVIRVRRSKRISTLTFRAARSYPSSD